MSQDNAMHAALEKLLDEHGLTPDTPLYREAERTALQATETPGVFRLAANASPGETVVDVYGQGYLVQAQQVGAGLAFAETTTPNWQETVEMRVMKAALDRTAAPSSAPVEVRVMLRDILAQGGLIYPVESVTVERAWYCTLPSGAVDVHEVL